LTGFTLIELMIVTVILVIIGLLALPYAGKNESTRLLMASRCLVADIEFAQMASIGDGEDPYVIVFSQAEGSYHLARQSDPNTPVTNPATQGPYVVRFGQAVARDLEGVSFDNLVFSVTNQLSFDSSGAPSGGGNASITLRCGSVSQQITIDGDTGEVSVP
jgi:prepilin-type N-terminal cleavage/methylation domain-containing protein